MSMYSNKQKKAMKETGQMLMIPFMILLAPILIPAMILCILFKIDYYRFLK